MRLPSMLLAGVVLLVGCSANESNSPTSPAVDIGNVFSVKSTFGPDFKLVTAGPGGIDSKLLAPQRLPDGVTFQPADCAEYATSQTLPPDLKGNMAAVIAAGQGNRFIAIGLETSEPVPVVAPPDNCRHITFSGPNLRGSVEVVDAPHIDGAQTIATHRVLEAEVSGGAGSGQIFTYVAYLGRYLVLVTADPLIAPDEPVAPVNVPRAQQLFTDAVAAVRG